jgi:biotin transport system substrate-specific component
MSGEDVNNAYAASSRRLVLADLIPGRLIRDISLVAGSAALVGVAAQISVPLPGTPVPVSMQTFAVLLVGATLGFGRAFAGLALYLAAGLAGVPWFADTTSGWHFASFGYVIGFAAAAALVGRLAAYGGDRTPLRTIGTMAAGSVVIYALGVPWLMGFTGAGLGQALQMGVVPFLIGDAVKIALAAGVLPSAWAAVGRFRK